MAGSGEELRPSATLVHIQKLQLFLREIINSLVSPQASASCRDLCFCYSRLANSDKPSCPRQLENADLKRNLLEGIREQTEEWKVALPGIGARGGAGGAGIPEMQVDKPVPEVAYLL